MKKRDIMNKSKSVRNTVIAVCLFIVIFGALLLTATLYDLEVSKILAKVNVGEYFTTSVFGAIFESIGSWPVYAMLSAAFAIIYSNTKRSSVKPLKILGSIAANIASVIAMAVLVFDTVSYITRHVSVPAGEAITSVFAKVVCVFIAAACGELLCYAFSRLDDDKAKALLRLSFVILFGVILANIFVNIIKNIMCRPRYRTMQCLNQPDENGNIFWNYHRWYQKFRMPEEGDPLYIAMSNGHKVGHDAYRSFPSGHTCAAGTIYAILALPKLLKKYDTPKMRALLCFIAVAVTGIVAVSRIVCGAHYFSDVLIGGTSTFVSMMLAIKIFIKDDFKKV